jgi:hypothetical protein
MQGSRINEVWLPSRWNRDAFVHAGLDAAKVRIVGEGIDTKHAFNPETYDVTRAKFDVLTATERRSFVFLSVFKFETRKAWRELVTA